MISRWLWWAPVGMLVLSFGLIGLRYGWVAATLTETDVINRYATQYMQSHGNGAEMTDCMAYPGDGQRGIWLVVSCQPANHAMRYDYHLNRLGRFAYSDHYDVTRRAGPET